MILFDESTKKFVRHIQGRNSNRGFIPASLNDSTKLQDSTRSYLVIKTQQMWGFQHPRYQVSDYTLEELMEEPPCPEWKKSRFLDEFEQSTEAMSQAGMGVDVPPAGGNAEVKHITEHKTTFGALDILQMNEILKVKVAIKDAIKKKPKRLDLDLKKGEKLFLLKTKIVTTTPSPLKGVDQVDANFMAKAKVHLARLFGSAAHKRTETCSMVVTPGSVIAYCVEQHTALNTQYSAQDDLHTDCFEDLTFLLDESTSQDTLAQVWKALPDFEKVLQPLAGLQLEEKRDLFQQLHEALKDRTVSQKPLEKTDGSPHESAVHLLVSALEELPDGALDMLATCSTKDLQALDTLVTQRKTNQPVSLESMPDPLQEFLCSSNETLRDMGDTLWEETGMHPAVLLLVLCIAIRGLASVCG